MSEACGEKPLVTRALYTVWRKLLIQRTASSSATVHNNALQVISKLKACESTLTLSLAVVIYYLVFVTIINVVVLVG